MILEILMALPEEVRYFLVLPTHITHNLIFLSLVLQH